MEGVIYPVAFEEKCLSMYVNTHVLTVLDFLSLLKHIAASLDNA